MHVLRPTEPAKNEYGLRPLYAAARLGHFDIVKALVEYGADINARAGTGLPAVYIAAEMGHTKVRLFLRGAGADLVDARFIDPVARSESNDEHGSILALEEYGDQEIKSNVHRNQLLNTFRKQSLREGGDGLKTLAKMFRGNGKDASSVLPLLAGASIGLLNSRSSRDA